MNRIRTWRFFEEFIKLILSTFVISARWFQKPALSEHPYREQSSSSFILVQKVVCYGSPQLPEPFSSI